MLDIIVKGGLMMLPIMLASIVSMALVIERILFWRRQKGAHNAIEIIREAEACRFERALSICDANASPVTRVLKAGILRRTNGAALAMEAEAIGEVREMGRYLPALDTIITLAPLLGLLGTIAGMISSFGIIAEAGLSKPLAVTGGISEALIATAAGIVVAVVTLIPHNFFQSRAEKATAEIERYATRLEMALALSREQAGRQ
ncbi:MAG TPA: MotA/TolQ/ExbB proton channel family protein [Thermodesulfobacteriota bacterium]